MFRSLYDARAPRIFRAVHTKFGAALHILFGLPYHAWLSDKLPWRNFQSSFSSPSPEGHVLQRYQRWMISSVPFIYRAFVLWQYKKRRIPRSLFISRDGSEQALLSLFLLTYDSEESIYLNHFILLPGLIPERKLKWDDDLRFAEGES